MEEKRRRHSIRLKEYDYSLPGSYFITILSYQKRFIFGKIEEKAFFINKYGEIIQHCWLDLVKHYPNLQLDAFTIMPNHIHGIITLKDMSRVRAGLKPALTKNHPLSEIIRGLKTFSARRINESRHSPRLPVWQRNYYEHVIRDEDELNNIRQYINDNVLNWNNDSKNNDLYLAAEKPG